MNFHKQLTVLFTIATLVGCASTEVIKYPTLTAQNTISVSNQQISAWNESGSGDYFVENSQILVGDSTNASGSKVTGAFGLLGVGIATAIDKNNNQNAIEKSTLNTAIKFDNLVNGKIKSSIESGELTGNLLNNNQVADIKITPFARLSFKDKPIMTSTFGLFVRFTNPATKKELKKTYLYIAKDKVKLQDWDTNNNQLFLNKADQAFSALTNVLALDLQNKIDSSKISATQQAKCKSDLAPTTVFLESPENLCIGVLFAGEKLASNTIVISEN